MRTPEQKAADDGLDEAIRACMKAEGQEELGVVVDHMVIVASTNFDGEDSLSSISFFTSGDIPYYRMLGMLDFIATGIRARIAAAHE